MILPSNDNRKTKYKVNYLFSKVDNPDFKVHVLSGFPSDDL